MSPLVLSLVLACSPARPETRWTGALADQRGEAVLAA